MKFSVLFRQLHFLQYFKLFELAQDLCAASLKDHHIMGNDCTTLWVLLEKKLPIDSFCPILQFPPSFCRLPNSQKGLQMAPAFRKGSSSRFCITTNQKQMTTAGIPNNPRLQNVESTYIRVLCGFLKEVKPSRQASRFEIRVTRKHVYLWAQLKQ